MREKRPGPGRPKGPARKRVQVTLSLEAWAMVEEIAELTDTPKASILAEMFDATLPSFVATIQALRVAKAQPREAQRLVQNFAAESVMALSQQQLDMDRAITEYEQKTAQKPLFAKKKRRKNAAS